MNNSKPSFAFVIDYVQDIERAMRFYVDVVGLEVERYHPTFVQFSNFAIASDASMSGNRMPELYWRVDDIQAAYEELSQGAEITVPLKQMPFGQVFGIKDPEGNPHYFIEFAQERPSRPVS